MLVSLSTVATLLASITSVTAVSEQIAHNYCNTPIYVTYNASGKTVGPTKVPSKGAYIANITGSGNSFGVTKNSDFYSPNTPKLILGTSTTSGTLYWSVSDVDGNPFANWNITSNGNTCSNATMYGSHVYSCADNGKRVLNVNLCTLQS